MNQKEKRKDYLRPEIEVDIMLTENILEGSTVGSINDFTNSTVEKDGWETM